MSWLGDAVAAGGAVSRGMAERDQFDTQQALQKQNLEAGKLSLEMNTRQNKIQQQAFDLDAAVNEGYQSWLAQPPDKKGTRPDMFNYLADVVAKKPGGWQAAEQFRQAHRAAIDEGILDLTRAGLNRSTPAEMERIFNSVGRSRVRPGSVTRDEKTGVYSAQLMDGSQTSFDPMRWGVTLGIIPPDEFEYKDGVIYGKKSGAFNKIGTGKLEEGFLKVNMPGGGEKVFNLNNPEHVQRLNDGDMGFAALSPDVQKMISSEVFNLLRADSFGALDPANQRRASVMIAGAQYLIEKGAINPSTGTPMTPSIAVGILEKETEGNKIPDNIQERLDSFLPKQAAGGAAASAAGSRMDPAKVDVSSPAAVLSSLGQENGQKMLNMLKANRNNPAARQAFDEKFGPGSSDKLLSQMDVDAPQLPTITPPGVKAASPSKVGVTPPNLAPARLPPLANMDPTSLAGVRGAEAAPIRIQGMPAPAPAASAASTPPTMADARPARPAAPAGVPLAPPPFAPPTTAGPPRKPGVVWSPSAGATIEGDPRLNQPALGDALRPRASQMPGPQDVEAAIRGLPQSMQGQVRKDLGLGSRAAPPSAVADVEKPLPPSIKPGQTPPAQKESAPPISTGKPGQTPISKPGPKPRKKSTSKPGGVPTDSLNEYDRAKGVARPEGPATVERSKASREAISAFQAEDVQWFKENGKNLSPEVRRLYADQINKRLQKGPWGGLPKGSKVTID